MAAKGLPIAGVTGTHQPRQPCAGRDVREGWKGAAAGRGVHANHPLPSPRSLAPRGLAAPRTGVTSPGEHHAPRLAPLPPISMLGTEARQRWRGAGGGREGMEQRGDVWGLQGKGEDMGVSHGQGVGGRVGGQRDTGEG